MHDQYKLLPTQIQHPRKMQFRGAIDCLHRACERHDWRNRRKINLEIANLAMSAIEKYMPCFLYFSFHPLMLACLLDIFTAVPCGFV